MGDSMDWSDWFAHFSASLSAGFFLRYIIAPLLMTTAFGGVLRFAFHKLKQRREIVAFGIGSFLLFLALMVFVARPQSPELNGGIQSVIAGQASGDERNTTAVFTVNITNTGNMQTIVKSWKVEASANGRKYDAVFPPMPSRFTFNNIPKNMTASQPESITYKSEDNILEKSLVPIQGGAIMPGILFVVFQNVDSSVFKAGADYTITFEDVFSKRYSMTISSSGKMDNISTFPGVHTEMVCPLPPGGIPKLGNDISTPATR
jgi:hypothetical protein